MELFGRRQEFISSKIEMIFRWDRERLQLSDEIMGAQGTAPGPRSGLIRIHGVARLEVTPAA
jgi:hypothetical protein